MYIQSKQNKEDIRNNRFQAIRKSLQQNPIFKANFLSIQNKIEKRRKRRQSVQLNLMLTQSQKNILLLQDDSSAKCMAKFHQKYIMGPKIGQGSDGFVKKCYLKTTNQIFAVKSIKMDQQHILFLKNNFKDIHALDHPNIIKYKNMYLDLKNNTSYLVMDYYSHPRLDQFKDLVEDQIKIIAQQLLGTLAYIHNCNICHRDIKPANILYDRKNQTIKLVDFGISKNVQNRGNKRQMLTITGTLYYRAPQMFSGGGYDQKVDVWAVGVTLFQLFAGRTPFQAEYLTETIYNIVRGQIYFYENIWNDCSKPAKDLIMRLLKKRQQRFTAQQAKKHFWFNKKPQIEIQLCKSESLYFKIGEGKIFFTHKYSLDSDNFQMGSKIQGLRKSLKKKLPFNDGSDQDGDNLIQIQSQQQNDFLTVQTPNNKKKESDQSLMSIASLNKISL